MIYVKHLQYYFHCLAFSTFILVYLWTTKSNRSLLSFPETELAYEPVFELRKNKWLSHGNQVTISGCSSKFLVVCTLNKVLVLVLYLNLSVYFREHQLWQKLKNLRGMRTTNLGVNWVTPQKLVGFDSFVYCLWIILSLFFIFFHFFIFLC